MKNLKNDREAVVLAIGLLGIIVIVIVALIIAAIISLMIGFLGFVGLMFLVASAYLLWRHKGQVTIAKNSPFFICIVLGLILISLSSVGLEIGYADLSTIPGLKELHMFFNS